MPEVPGNTGNHDARQEVAALGLARGMTARKAAARAGVTERTLFTWRTQRAFLDRVAALRSELFEAAVNALAGMTGKAARQLRKLLDSPDEKTRLAAIRLVADWGKAARETGELAERLAAVEARLRLKARAS
jgi:hypothetical protein